MGIAVGKIKKNMGTEASYKKILSAVYGRDTAKLKTSITENDHKEIYEHGMTMLHEAAWLGHDEIAAELIKGGAELNGKTKVGGYTPLHYAALYGRAGIASTLMAAGAKTDINDDGGETALQTAQRRGFADIAAIISGK